jgi:hypothetical protein
MRSDDSQVNRALFRFARDDDRLLLVATSKERFQRTQIQSTLNIRWVIAMTRQAFFMQERLNATYKQRVVLIMESRRLQKIAQT